MMRHVARVALDFNRWLTRIWLYRCLRGETEAVGLDQRLGQVHRVLDDHRVSQQVAVAQEALGHPRAIAEGQSVTAHPPGLQMGSFDDEHAAFPPAGREALPRMRIEVGRTRPAIHPDFTALLHPLDVSIDLTDQK